MPRPKIAVITAAIAAAVIVSGALTAVFLPRSQQKPQASSVFRSSIKAETLLPQGMPSFQNDIRQAKLKNKDTVGWLRVTGTTLNRAIVQTTNNNYYLEHDFNKQDYWKGWPFADFRNKLDPLPRNLIIYGHNMGDGTLFGELKNYDELSFLNQNPIIYFSTAQGDYQYKIFAVYITDTNFYYIKTDFKDDADYMDFVSKIRARSLYNMSVDVTASDKILTLSTCTYEFKGARFVVQARLVRPGEYLWTPPATYNNNALSPQNATHVE